VEEGLKKRLLGAAVLASLAVIFIPMLIDDQSVGDTALHEIPAVPERRSFSSSMLKEEVIRPQLPRPVVVAEIEKVSVEPIEAEKPKEIVKPLTGLNAWVVQVGSFSSSENANKLIAKLRKAGFQTQDAERIQIRGKTWYRVRVGPMVEKQKAQKLVPKINKITGEKTRVQSYP